MWLILISICTASFKFIGADEPQVLQKAAAPVQKLQYSPSLNSPLPYSPPSSYVSTNFNDKGLKVSSTQSEINRQFEVPQMSPPNCPQLESLESILVLLKRILNQNENAHLTQPDKRIQILQYLKEFLEMSGSRVSEIQNHEKLHELMQRAYNSLLVDNNISHKTVTDNNDKNHVEANFIFKYDIPNINNIGCKEALATLTQTVKDAHLQLINYCKQTGKCNLNSEIPLHAQYSDKTNFLHNTITLGQSMPGEAKISVLNSNLLNTYGIQNAVKNLVDANNQLLSQTNLNNNINHSSRQLDLNDNQFLNTNNMNANIVKTLNNQEKNVDAFNNIYLNTKTTQSNQLHSDQSNALNGFLSFYKPVSTQPQITPSDPNLFNVPIVQSPLNNFVVMPHTQVDPQRVSNGYSKPQEQPQPYLNQNQLLTNGALNAGFVKTENKQEKNIDISNKYFNMLKNNDLLRFLNTPTSGNQYFQTYNPIPLQNPHVDRYLPTNNNQANQQLYTLSQTFNNNRQSMAIKNQNHQDIKEQTQYNTASFPIQYYNPNYLAYIKPNEIRTFAVPDLTLTNSQVNLGQFQNQNMGLISPSPYSSLKTEQNPYLSSINLNRQNSLNYNSQKADASVQSNYGLNLLTSSNLADYPKHDIYGKTLVDSQRLASASNLVKLNSDNEGIVELTYKLKRPQSINYNPYYYVKFRMPYRDFVSKITDLTRNQNIRPDPLKLHQELLSVSNLKEASSDIKSIQQDEVSKFIVDNGATLINAQVLGNTNDTKANEYLKTIQNLNANLKTNEILNLVDRDQLYNQPMSLGSDTKAYNQSLSLGSEIPAYNQPLSLGSEIPAYNEPLLLATEIPAQYQPISLGSDVRASERTLQPQYNLDLQHRRLIPRLKGTGSSLGNHLITFPVTFLPAATQTILNPLLPQTLYATLN